ncbi:MAG: hypothetical protein QXL88_01785 [Candidatus Pacearchaeota archaeon]
MKRVVIFALILILLLASIQTTKADLTEQQKIENVYSWLINKTKNKWQNLNTKENALALLALKANSTYLQQGNSSLWRRSFSDASIRCWGIMNASSEKDCKLVETSIAKLALDELGMNTTKVTNWILSKKKVQRGIHWYLQIDVDRNADALCEIYYLDKSEKIFIINTDKTVRLNGTSTCFEIATTPTYWFKLKDTPECLKEEYAIKCWSENATYVTATFLYKKSPADNKWYVSAQTASGFPAKPDEPAQDLEPRLKVPSYCLGEGDTCNYEGTLWAAYVLAKQQEKENANLFVPYLIVNKEDGNNKGYFPSAFLAFIIDGVFVQETINLQQRAGYWKIQKADGGTFYGTLYNTALAKLMLQGNADFEKAKEWILKTYNQETATRGYFSDPAGGTESATKIIENAFVLWQFWPHLAPGYGGAAQCAGIGGSCKYVCSADEIDEGQLDCPPDKTCCKITGGETYDCIAQGGTCKEECSTYELEWHWSCLNNQKCCVSYFDLNCEEMNGTFCNETQECIGKEVESRDSYGETCCLGTCVPKDFENKYCEEDYIGEKCLSRETCIDESRDIIEFIKTKDTERCCTGECVLNKYCSEIGTKCETGECVGNIRKTLDTDYCCEGSCETKKPCDELGGVICSSDEICTRNFATNALEPRCCLGECKKKAKFPFWIIIIVAAAIAAFYFFFIRKKPEEEKEEFPFMKPVKPMPPAKPLLIQPKAKALPAMPLQKSPPEIAPIEIPKLPEEKKILTAKKKPKEKREKSELEKTLEKLRRMTKK